MKQVKQPPELTAVRLQNHIDHLEARIKDLKKENSDLKDAMEQRIQGLSILTEQLQKKVEQTISEKQNLNQYYQAALLNIADSLTTLTHTITIMMGRTNG